MIEVFDDFLTIDEIDELFKTLRESHWLLEEKVDYSPEKISEGGAKIRYFKELVENTIYWKIFVRLNSLPLIQGKYKFVSHYINAYKNGDITALHVDESDLTALIYGNPKWDINWGAETIFTETKSPDTEIIASVIPKPGRLVIFDSSIPHAGRPPSPSFSNHRYSVAYNLKKIV
jgi:hypothetical protein